MLFINTIDFSKTIDTLNYTFHQCPRHPVTPGSPHFNSAECCQTILGAICSQTHPYMSCMQCPHLCAAVFASSKNLFEPHSIAAAMTVAAC